jgi:hypothetical protein
LAIGRKLGLVIKEEPVVLHGWFFILEIFSPKGFKIFLVGEICYSYNRNIYFVSFQREIDYDLGPFMVRPVSNTYIPKGGSLLRVVLTA